MNPVDIAILALIGSFGLAGFFYGFLHTIGSLIGMFMGFFVASQYYQDAGVWLEGVTGWGTNVSNVIVFILLYILVSRIIGLVFWLIGKPLKLASIIPFSKLINRLLGLAFGLLEGLIIVGFVIYFIDKYPVTDAIIGYIDTSSYASYATTIALFILPLLQALPEILDLPGIKANVEENIFSKVYGYYSNLDIKLLNK
jgi:membrane protein required for colicin V production